VYNFQSFIYYTTSIYRALAVPFDLEAKSLLKFTVTKKYLISEPTSNDLPVEIQLSPDWVFDI
jgi:hypothetical protein